jgi:hypothetical protein
MKFTLIYDGQLPAGKNKRSVYAARIRNSIHPQLRDLWDNHVIMRQLRHEAIVNNHRMIDLATEAKPPSLPDFSGPPPPLRDNQVDLCAPMSLNGVGAFLPIIRKELYLACQIDILMMRHEDPGHLFDADGDIDNRLKCFFDALTIPNKEQAQAGENPCFDPLCVLLQDDKLISDFSVRTARLLGRTEKNQYDVRIQADVTIKVLRMFGPNQALMGNQG